MYGQMISGGPYDDKIWSGNNVGSNGNLGAGSFDLLIYGDKDDFEDEGTGVPTPDADYGLPLVEYPLTFNKNDGNDIIDVGDDNANVGVYGQGGNDKIIGGSGAS